MLLRKMKEDGSREREPDFIDIRNDPIAVFFVVVEGDFNEACGHIRRRRFVHRFSFAVTIVAFADAAIGTAINLQKFLVDEFRETFAFAALAMTIDFRSAHFTVEGV